MAAALNAQTIETISLPTGQQGERRDIYACRFEEHPRAILVLCPGQNRDGREMLEQEQWKGFAKDNNLALVALSFASSEKAIQAGEGYFDAGRQSGEMLLTGIKQMFGGNLPLLLYGFSGGAHFVNTFVNWKPDSVLGFCAYSAGWWEPPSPDKKSPPGLVVCGTEDAERYSASQRFFSQGRAAGNHWTWLSLGNTGHQPSKPLDEFVRIYFASLLVTPRMSFQWRDVDTKELMTPAQARDRPTLACWLPDPKVGERWSALHEP